MDPWTHRAAAGAAASAAAVCIYFVRLGGAPRAPLDVRDTGSILKTSRSRWAWQKLKMLSRSFPGDADQN